MGGRGGGKCGGQGRWENGKFAKNSREREKRQFLKCGGGVAGGGGGSEME